MGKIHLLVISHQSLFRQGIEHSLAGAEDIEVSSTACTDDDVFGVIEELPPDVAMVDIDGPPGNGLALAHRVKQRSPNIAVVMLTSTPNDAQLFQALKAQAVAYLSKEITADQLVDIVHRVIKGEHPINESLTTRPKVAEQVLQQFQDLYKRSETQEYISPLTPRETEILNYIAQGFLNKQIAIELGISEQTIKNHVTSILRKLNANARTEAVVVAIRQGLICIR